MKRIQEDRERSKKIYAMRCDRKSYKEIAKNFGISVTRAKQIFCREHARKLSLEPDPDVAQNVPHGQG
ncbi:MAG: hypothetical protein KGJ13_05505 [Patescibacteria group bacterium]|nr:hypothetical protein [Patescibacteria group bacterium]